MTERTEQLNDKNVTLLLNTVQVLADYFPRETGVHAAALELQKQMVSQYKYNCAHISPHTNPERQSGNELAQNIINQLCSHTELSDLAVRQIKDYCQRQSGNGLLSEKELEAALLDMILEHHEENKLPFPISNQPLELIRKISKYLSQRFGTVKVDSLKPLTQEELIELLYTRMVDNIYDKHLTPTVKVPISIDKKKFIELCKQNSGGYMVDDVCNRTYVKVCVEDLADKIEEFITTVKVPTVEELAENIFNKRQEQLYGIGNGLKWNTSTDKEKYKLIPGTGVFESYELATAIHQLLTGGEK